ncbi:hypothetical protein DAI22_04g063700 [Oryza sativa Japonica Group]|uniref:OSJNBb0032D24.12 protein n=1 Tax=Oryza sativa subsp. japonica TaxID=39947 RepID=Q7XNI1_ORYSJ|nr:hypothetical protein DAI22_04g063700 [Oryza sativa Japonica Group]CAE04082.2 OSJNBb0032D24.12 [Oryza sativa Japonica Group]
MGHITWNSRSSRGAAARLCSWRRRWLRRRRRRLFESGVEGCFAVSIRQDGPRIGYEAGGMGEGGIAGVKGVRAERAVEQVGGLAIVRFDDGGVTGGWDGGVEAEDEVGVGGPGREAVPVVMGGAEGDGGDQEGLPARGAWVEAKGLDE